MDIIVGTAGHIDHGKTSLVLALTGVNADRLPEEKQRGITIDLGFAELDAGDVRIGFVDVPGHERFVKNMLAGASGIDIVALVVAADEGVMPQTREHFDICRLLDTKHGIVVLTKSDLVEEEFLELVKTDVAGLVAGSFLESAPVIEASSKSGEGIETVRDALVEKASEVSARSVEKSTRLAIDRSFSMKGFGAVVTGTLAAGTISEGDEMDLMPDGIKVRVRGIQTHGSSVESVFAGRRTAVNLGGIDHEKIERGMVLAESDSMRSTQIIDCIAEVLKDAAKPLKSKQRVRVHFGTVEVLARVEVLNEAREIAPGEKDFIQLRFEKPVPGIPTERFILRQYSPQITIAGGRFLDVLAKKRKRTDLEFVRKCLTKLAETEIETQKLLETVTSQSGQKGRSVEELRALTGLKSEPLREALNIAVSQSALVEAEGVFAHKPVFEQMSSLVLREIEEHHKNEPLSRGIAKETLRGQTKMSAGFFKKVLSELELAGTIKAAGDVVALSSHSSELTPEEESVKRVIIDTYQNAKLHVPALNDALALVASSSTMDQKHARKLFQMLVDSKELIKVSDEFYFLHDVLDQLISDIKTYAEDVAENRLIGVPEFKDVAGVSRKYAIPLLEYFDGAGITRRAGDKRIVL